MRLKKLATALLLTSVATASSFLGGCVDNRATLYVDSVIGFDAESDECTLSNSITLGSGSWDPLAGQPYVAFMGVGNQLAPRGDTRTLQAETSIVELRGAEIRIETPDGSAGLPAFTTNFAFAVYPATGSNIQITYVQVPLIPAEAAGALTPNTTYNIRVKIFGETLGGSDVETGEFLFPVRVTAPGTYMACAQYGELDALDVVHPCGSLAQDGFFIPCLAPNDQPISTDCAALCR